MKLEQVAMCRLTVALAPLYDYDVEHCMVDRGSWHWSAQVGETELYMNSLL